MSFRKYVPLESIAPWPATWPAPTAGIGIVSQDVITQVDRTTAYLGVLVDADLEFDVPGVEGMSILLPGAPTAPISVEVDLSSPFQLRVIDVGPTIRFHSALFRRVENVAALGEVPDWQPVVDGGGSPAPVNLSLGLGTLIIDSEFRPSFESAVAVMVPTVMIGNSGVVVEGTEVTLYLGGNESPPVGQSPGFRGASLDSVRVWLPSDLVLDIAPEDVSGTGVVIGTGGVSGTFAGAWAPTWTGTTVTGRGSGTLFGSIQFGLEDLSISLAQNSLVAGGLRGRLALPFFDEVVAVSMAIGTDGEFSVSLSTTEIVYGRTGARETSVDTGEIAIERPGLFAFGLRALNVRRESGSALLEVSGSLSLRVPGVTWPEVRFDNLQIDSAGNVMLPGGWLNLAEPLAVGLYGFSVEVTQLGFGNTKDGRRFIALSGGVHLGAGLPVGASVEGLKVIWDPSGTEQPEITLEGVGIDLTLPGIKIEARVAFRRETDETGEVTAAYFEGSAKVTLEALDVTIDGSVKIGRSEGTAGPFTFVYVFLDLKKAPVGIPVGPTGTAIYGIAGLFGANVTPGKTPDQTWYQWYASDVDPPTDITAAFSMTDERKWVPAEGAFAVGAGLTLGTLFDSGFSFNTKALLVLVTPGPVVMLNGKANILSVPPELPDDTEGALDLFAVLDGNAGTLQLNLDASYQVPRTIDIAAAGEAWFEFADPDAWHVYIGQDQPEGLRVRPRCRSVPC